MPDEIVFTVEGAKALPATRIALSDAGLTERAHLQEWVLAHPSIMGDGILIVTSEFDAWKSASQYERDRLDVLGLDRQGRLVVAELKRDQASDTVEMQAIKYAAMSSRFTPEVVVSHYAEFRRRRGEVLSDEDALQTIAEHVGGDLDSDLLRQPRVVLIASAFPATVTATVVWLSEMGLDISLVRVQAYQAQNDVVVTTSQIFPIPDVEDFTVAPIRARARRARHDDYPEIPWDEEALAAFAAAASNPTVLAAMALCSASPGELVSIRELEAAAGRTPHQVRADLAGLTMMVKHRFHRSNWPFSYEWAAGGDLNMYYRMDPSVAATWSAVKSASHPGGSDPIPAAAQFGESTR